MAKVVKINNFHRNRNIRHWTPLVQAHVPEDAAKTGVEAVAQNHLYTVFIKMTKSPGFEQMGKDGKPEPMPMSHLIIIRNDHKDQEIPWNHKQRIKDELCGPMCEAVELFPAKWRVQDIMKQTHLWVLLPGVTFPVGLFPDPRQAANPANVVVTKEDLEVFVVRGEGFIEVFASEKEAQDAYAAAGNTLTGGTIERIGNVPTSDDGAAWTDAAKAKVANIIAKAEALDRMNTPTVGEDVVSPFHDDGPDSVEEEIGFTFDMSLMDTHAEKVYGPPSVEENIQIAEYMERKMAEIKSEREMQIANATRQIERKVVDEDAEKAAADELAEIRKKLVNKPN